MDAVATHVSPEIMQDNSTDNSLKLNLLQLWMLDKNEMGVKRK